MEVSLNLFGICFATVKELFLLYLSSLRACGLAIQYPKLAGNGGGGKGRNPESKQPPYERPKKKNHNSSSAHSKTHPRNLQRVKKSSTENCKRKSFPLTLRTVFSCQITTQENTIIRIKKKETKKLAPQGLGSRSCQHRFERKQSKGNPIHFPPRPPASPIFILSPDPQASLQGLKFNNNNKKLLLSHFT